MVKDLTQSLSGSQMRIIKLEHPNFQLPTFLDDYDDTSSSSGILTQLGVERAGQIKQGSPGAAFLTGGPPPGPMDDSEISRERRVTNGSLRRSRSGSRGTFDSKAGSRSPPRTSVIKGKPLPKCEQPQVRLHECQINELKKAFNILGRGDDKIDTKDLQIMFRACGFNPTRDEIKCFSETVDPKQSGQIGFDEFVKAFTMKVQLRGTTDELTRAFQFFDKDQSGKITFDNLRMTADEIGENLEDEEIQEMIDEADTNGAGFVSFQDFIRLMTKSNNYEFEE